MAFGGFIGKALGLPSTKDLFSGAFSGLGGSLVSGALSLIGGNQQNNSAKDLAASNNAMAIELANTAHQRETRDLLAAGLNPILSVNSGASTPSLATAPITNALGDAGHSAFANRTQSLQMDVLRQQAATGEADAALKKEQRLNTLQQTITSDQQAQLLHQQQKLLVKQIPSLVSKAAAEASSAKSAAVSAAAQAEADALIGTASRVAGGVLGSAKSLSGIAGDIKALSGAPKITKHIMEGGDRTVKHLMEGGDRTVKHILTK